MSVTICGYDRGWLITWLHVAAERPNLLTRSVCDCEPCVTRNALIDPAKLAAIMADRLRIWGVYAYCYADGTSVVIVDANEYGESALGTVRLTMSKTHAALLRILMLPDGSTPADAIKTLNGIATVDPDELINTIPVRPAMPSRQHDCDPDRERDAS